MEKIIQYINATISLMGSYPELSSDRNSLIVIRENVKKLIEDGDKKKRNTPDPHKEWTERMRENVSKLNPDEAKAALDNIDRLINDLE